MTNWGLAALLLTGEGLVFTQTLKAFTVESRLTRRGEDIRQARAGFEAAVLAKLADTYSEAEDVKRSGESVRDTLTGSDFSQTLTDLSEMTPKIHLPNRAETRLRRATYTLAACLATGHIAALLAFVDNIKRSAFLPEPYDGLAAVVFVLAVGLALITTLAVLRLDISFEKAIRDGKAADA